LSEVELICITNIHRIYRQQWIDQA